VSKISLVIISKNSKVGSSENHWHCVSFLSPVMPIKRDKIKRKKIPYNPKDNFEKNYLFIWIIWLSYHLLKLSVILIKLIKSNQQ